LSQKTQGVERWMREWGQKFEICPFPEWQALARDAANAFRGALPLATYGDARASAFIRECADAENVSLSWLENQAFFAPAPSAHSWGDLRGSWAIWLLGVPPAFDSAHRALTGLAWSATIKSEPARDARESAALGRGWLSRMASRSEWAASADPNEPQRGANGEEAAESADPQSVRMAALLLCALGERAQSNAGFVRRIESDALTPSLAEFMELMGADWMRLPDGAIAIATRGLQKWAGSGAAVDAQRPAWQKMTPLSALRMCARIGAASDFAHEDRAWKKERRALAEWLVDRGASLTAQEPGGLSVLTDWCDAAACEDWDSEWPLIVSRIAAGTDVNAADGAGWTPLARLAGAALPWARHWQGEAKREPLRWALQMAEALVAEGANPSPRLPGGGRLASWDRLDSRWRDFLNSHLQARALAGAVSHQRASSGKRQKACARSAQEASKKDVSGAESSEKEERRSGARRL